MEVPCSREFCGRKYEIQAMTMTPVGPLCEHCHYMYDDCLVCGEYKEVTDGLCEDCLECCETI